MLIQWIRRNRKFYDNASLLGSMAPTFVMKTFLRIDFSKISILRISTYL